MDIKGLADFLAAHHEIDDDVTGYVGLGRGADGRYKYVSKKESNVFRSDKRIPGDNRKVASSWHASEEFAARCADLCIAWINIHHNRCDAVNLDISRGTVRWLRSITLDQLEAAIKINRCGQYSSRYRGVNWNKRSAKWQARIRNSGRHIHLGWFEDETEAARAYDAAAVKLPGRRAHLNFQDRHAMADSGVDSAPCNRRICILPGGATQPAVPTVAADSSGGNMSQDAASSSADEDDEDSAEDTIALSHVCAAIFRRKEAFAALDMVVHDAARSLDQVPPSLRRMRLAVRQGAKQMDAHCALEVIRELPSDHEDSDGEDTFGVPLGEFLAKLQLPRFQQFWTPDTSCDPTPELYILGPGAAADNVAEAYRLALEDEQAGGCVWVSGGEEEPGGTGGASTDHSASPVRASAEPPLGAPAAPGAASGDNAATAVDTISGWAPAAVADSAEEAATAAAVAEAGVAPTLEIESDVGAVLEMAARAEQRRLVLESIRHMDGAGPLGGHPLRDATARWQAYQQDMEEAASAGDGSLCLLPPPREPSVRLLGGEAAAGGMALQWPHGAWADVAQGSAELQDVALEGREEPLSMPFEQEDDEATQHFREVRGLLRRASDVEPGVDSALPSRSELQRILARGGQLRSAATGSVAAAAERARAATWAVARDMDHAASLAYDYVQSHDILLAGGVHGVHPQYADRAAAVAAFRQLGHIPWPWSQRELEEGRAERARVATTLASEVAACEQVLALAAARDTAAMASRRCGPADGEDDEMTAHAHARLPFLQRQAAEAWAAVDQQPTERPLEEVLRSGRPLSTGVLLKRIERMHEGLPQRVEAMQHEVQQVVRLQSEVAALRQVFLSAQLQQSGEHPHGEHSLPSAEERVGVTGEPEGGDGLWWTPPGSAAAGATAVGATAADGTAAATGETLAGSMLHQRSVVGCSMAHETQAGGMQADDAVTRSAPPVTAGTCVASPAERAAGGPSLVGMHDAVALTSSLLELVACQTQESDQVQELLPDEILDLYVSKAEADSVLETAWHAHQAGRVGTEEVEKAAAKAVMATSALLEYEMRIAGSTPGETSAGPAEGLGGAAPPTDAAGGPCGDATAGPSPERGPMAGPAGRTAHSSEPATATSVTNVDTCQGAVAACATAWTGGPVSPVAGSVGSRCALGKRSATVLLSREVKLSATEAAVFARAATQIDALVLQPAEKQ